MAKAKYFAGIEEAQRPWHGRTDAALAPFNFASLLPPGRLARLSSSIANALIPAIYALSRRFFPILPLAGLVHVTRDAQVREILLRPDDFITPFGPEMKELGGGATFVLGLQGEEHERQHRIISAIVRHEDGRRIADMSGRFAEALLEASKGRIDVIPDLLKRVPSEICLRYFGLRCPDIDGLGDWTMALSAFLFGDPYGEERTRALALNAAARIDKVIAEALVRTRFIADAGKLDPQEADTLIERLVLMERAGEVDEDEIRAILMGLSTGFIPTNTLAAARMLQVLLARPEAMAMARRAAQAGDTGAMRRIVLEAGRLNPALAPGQWRHAPRDTEIEVDGRKHAIKAGTTLLVSTMSAMRDSRAVKDPGRFWPDRTGPDGQWQEPDLVFGIGPHTCIGKHLAIEQITALFMVLMKQEGLRPARGRAGQMQSIGPFPRHLALEFDTPASAQSMFLVIAPVTSGKSKSEIDALIAPLGNPASTQMRDALDETGLVHFSSLASLPTERGLLVSWELTVDGPRERALDRIAACAGPLLAPVFAECGLGQGDLAAFWQGHIVELHGKPWGANGLNYNGLAEFPVHATQRQARLAEFAERAVSDFVASEAVRGSHAMLALNHVRRIVAQDPALRRTGTRAQRELMAEAAREGFDALRLKPASASVRLADFRPMTPSASFAAFLRSRESLVVTLPALAVLILFLWVFPGADTGRGAAWNWIGSALGALLATIAAMAALTALFFALIRRKERTDWIDPTQASLEHLAAINAHEDAPGHVQNHILAMGEIKPGPLRAFAHAFALWGIRMIITFNYRPGFVINMGTIHFARWWRVPGTAKTVFYSNFDGSWESYLEDFITRARWGQSAAWSNWKGFPDTRFLIFKGAEQGDDFKRWVRTRQQVVPFWYSRFPALTTDRIRTNALIHQGLAHAMTGSEAEEWLRCFGSMPRVENRIQSDEVQAIVFSGLGQLRHSASLVVKLPQGRMLGEWLGWVRGERQALDRIGDAGSAEMTSALSSEGIIVPVRDASGATEGYCLANSLSLTFGDRPLMGDASVDGMAPEAIDGDDPLRYGKADARTGQHRAVFLGLSAKGMAKLQVPGEYWLDGFPASFRMGMASRGRILGDHGQAAADCWRWSDAEAEAVLFVYGETPDDLAFLADVHCALVENYGGKILHRLECAPPDPGKPEFEHFGYRDGISQPVIKGTGRAARGAPARDLIEPGEFILGYGNGQGFLPPSPVMSQTADPEQALPTLSNEIISRYPDFGERAIRQAPRDLGRNGSYVVIRELAQDVAGFEAFVEARARELSGQVPTADGTHYRDLYKVIGQYPDSNWVKAKLMGRWPSGRPLIGNPIDTPPPVLTSDCPSPGLDQSETENDFAYGSDDPHGYACPFASHIRRTNPRDSKQPGDTNEQVISNRHRLLRRGRTYTRQQPGGPPEKGLLFVSLCADIDRQFEFVQQHWANSGGFHGLSNEPDPIVGSTASDAVTGCPVDRGFTIPTPAGPIRLCGLSSFVSVRAGGYFFLPSRSALTWMTWRALAADEDRSAAIGHRP